MESRKEKEAYDRYDLVVKLLKGRQDKKGLRLVEDLVQKAARYIRVVANVEEVGKLQRFHQETDEQMREKLVNLDKVRRLAHEALIAQLNIVNRYLFRSEDLRGQVPPGGIFSLNPATIKDRNAVGTGQNLWRMPYLEGGL